MLRFLTLTFLSLVAFASTAQTTSFIHYGVERGLTQSQVQTINQDDDGNLWVGTLSGVYKYDGKHFAKFTKRNGLAEEWATCSYKDNAGNLWWGHWGGGISFYNVALKTFENLYFEQHSNFTSVNSIVEDKDGNIWVATEGNGVLKMTADRSIVENFTRNDGLPSNNINDLVFDANSQLWIATDNGLVCFNNQQNFTKEGALKTYTSKDGFPSNNFEKVCLLHNKDLAIAQDAKVAVVKIVANRLVTEDIFLLNQQAGTRNDKVSSIIEDHNDNLWVGYESTGAMRYSLKDGEYMHYDAHKGLNYSKVNALFEDRENNVWIATDLGLNQYQGEIFQLYNEADGLINNIVWAVIEDSKRNLWFGTNGGLSKLSMRYVQPGGSANNSIRNYTESIGIPDKSILSLFEAADGLIWIGTADGGACSFNPKTEKVVVYNKSKGLPHQTVFSINQDKNGDIWFGTRVGASKLEVKTGKFTNYTSDDGLGGNNIYRIYLDSKGRLWFAALGGILSMYDGNSFRSYGKKEGVDHKFILTISEDENKNIWFGAYGGGLYKFDGEKFENFDSDKGLFSNTPYSIINDLNDKLWIGTNLGIEKFDETSQTSTLYTKSEGFWGVEVNPNAVCRDSYGNIWFGSIMGAVKYNPKEDRGNDSEPITLISPPKVFFKEFPIPAVNEYAYNQNHLSFDFIGISLRNPQKVMYQYKLEGFDEEWSPFTTITNAVYSNLPPGKYTFQVKARNDKNVWNTTATEFSFVILPPFWQTWWFYTLMALIVILGWWFIDRFRTESLINQNKALEDKVRERTRELDIKNIELSTINKDITDSIRYAKRIQDGILPSDREIKRMFPQSFVFYKPKDIVSGDFYWFQELQTSSSKKFLAAVDCTGHGVPGAFVSIVGYNGLNRVMQDFGMTDTGKILDNLSLMVESALHQNDELDVKDGMDIALCCYDEESQTMHFSGANNGIYVVREKVKQSDIAQLPRVLYYSDNFAEIKPDKQPVGPHQNRVPFTTQSFKIEKGDTVYLFTDGFADQFGGPLGKKYKYNQMKEYLLSIQQFSMEEQQRMLLETFEKWRGPIDQVDDVLIIGVRF